MFHRKHLQQEFLDHGVLTLLKNWLEPLPDGSMPNMNIRSAVLKLLTDVGSSISFYIFCIVEPSCVLMAPKNLIASFMLLVVSN
jgi:hypothetical protein